MFTPIISNIRFNIRKSEYRLIQSSPFVVRINGNREYPIDMDSENDIDAVEVAKEMHKFVSKMHDHINTLNS